MNVALEDTEEWAGGRVTARYGDCFLRGNNGESLATLGLWELLFERVLTWECCISRLWKIYERSAAGMEGR